MLRVLLVWSTQAAAVSVGIVIVKDAFALLVSQPVKSRPGSRPAANQSLLLERPRSSIFSCTASIEIIPPTRLAIQDCGKQGLVIVKGTNGAEDVVSDFEVDTDDDDEGKDSSDLMAAQRSWSMIFWFHHNSVNFTGQ